jgi:hypothetical protein
MTSRAARVAVLSSVLSLVLLAAPAAQAQRLAVSDPSGDADGGKLDITRAALANRDYRLVARIALAELERGDVIVSVDRRRGHGVRLVARRAADGSVRGRLLPGAFTDRGTGSALTCDRIAVTWNDDASRVSLRMPSRCWNDGDYGAVRFAVLTERGSGDRDWAPADADGGVGVSGWVPRG